MRGQSGRISASVAVGLALVGAAGAGGLYLGLIARTSFATADAAAVVAADMSPSDTVNLRFPADWIETATATETVAAAETAAPAEVRPVMLASADSNMALFSPQPIAGGTGIVGAAPAAPASAAPAPAREAEVNPPEAAAKPVETAPKAVEATPKAAKVAALAPNAPAGNSAPATPKFALASVSSKPATVAPKPVHRSNAVLNDSQIASIKRRLNLTPDQQRYWPAVEAELRKMEYRKDKGARVAAIDTSKVNIEGLKSAGFPLVMSFSDDQRRELRSLAHLLGLESAMSGI